MSNSSLAPGALAVVKRVKSSAKADKAVYAAVDARDSFLCRACGYCAGIDVERHHLRGRKFTTVNDVCHLCHNCHDRLHVRLGGKTLKVYGDADARGRFTGLPNGLTVETRQTNGRWVLEAGR